MDAKKALKDKVTEDLPVTLRPDEHVIVRAIISNGIYWKTVALGIIAILISLVAYQLGILFAVVTFVAFCYAFIIKHALLMVVTNQRIFIRAGVIKVDTVQIRYDRIESVEIQRTIPGQFLHYATVVVSGTGTTLAFIPYMANAKQVRDTIDELLYNREEKPQHVIVDKVEG